MPQRFFTGEPSEVVAFARKLADHKHDPAERPRSDWPEEPS
jgi:hypothetical protein